MGSVFTYDTTPGSNTQTGDGTSVAEGVNAALVNNAQRSVMADIANWRDVIGGAKTAGGTANALTLTTGVSVPSYADGQMYSFVAVSDNTGAATLNVDAVGVKAIRKDGDIALVGGELKEGGHYIVQYDASANASAGAFLLINSSGYFKDREAEGTIASAATCDIGAETEYRLNVTGTTTITSFGTAANSMKLLRFSDVVTLTYNATSLILPGADNINTAAGDMVMMVSDGSGNWRCVSYQRAANAPTGYRFGSQQVFTSSGTWTKPAGCIAVRVRVQGGGGSGGGSGVTANRAGGGGGGGGYSEKYITSGLSATETVTVGAGGAAGSSSGSGNAGGTSSFGAHCSAAGGSGGPSSGGGSGGSGGSGSGGDVNITGGDGGPPSIYMAVAGSGGSSVLGGGGSGGQVDTRGLPGNNYGGGGGGSPTSDTSALAGDVGAPGIVIVDEYY